MGNNLTKPHLNLYRLMHKRHRQNDQFTKADALYLYKKYVMKRCIDHYGEFKYNKHYRDAYTQEIVARKAYHWLTRGIAILIKHGYVGLTFNREIKPVIAEIE